jgi:hypothetical protein
MFIWLLLFSSLWHLGGGSTLTLSADDGSITFGSTSDTTLTRSGATQLTLNGELVATTLTTTDLVVTGTTTGLYRRREKRVEATGGVDFGVSSSWAEMSWTSMVFTPVSGRSYKFEGMLTYRITLTTGIRYLEFDFYVDGVQWKTNFRIQTSVPIPSTTGNQFGTVYLSWTANCPADIAAGSPMTFSVYAIADQSVIMSVGANSFFHVMETIPDDLL